MIYKKFGNAFRQIREQKSLALSDFTPIGISTAALSRFERAETMMGFDKVVQALQFMGVSLEEYENLLNNNSPDESSSFIKEIEFLRYDDDKKGLHKLYKIIDNFGYPYIALATKASFTQLTLREIDDITDFFYNIQIWSYIELFTFYFTMDQLNIHDILYLIDIFLLDKNHKIFNSQKYKDIFVRICCRAIFVYSHRGYREYAEHIIHRIDTRKLINSMFLRNLFNFSKGYWIYKFKNKRKGNALMIYALDTFYSLSLQEVAEYYQKQYDKYIN